MLVFSTLVASKNGVATRGADVAQLVEQLIRNEQVTGSNPAIGSIFLAKNSAGTSQGVNGSIFLAEKLRRNVPRGKRLHKKCQTFGLVIFMDLMGASRRFELSTKCEIPLPAFIIS